MLIPNRLRTLLYKVGGIWIGKKSKICAHCFVGNSNLKIGDNCFINYEVWFNTAGGIKIGDNCNIAYKVVFATSSHEVGSKERRAGNNTSTGISVGDGSWIGARAMIMPGVKIGKGVVIGAGSVITKHCEDNGLYVGNPAKKVRQLL